MTKKDERIEAISKGIIFLKRAGLKKKYLRTVRDILLEEEFNPKQIDFFIKEIYTHYKRALVVPREPVGTVAAQSIGEPGTQMTLRTFHYAGVSEFSVTQGLPRLIEIVDARRNPSTPIMDIYLDKNHRHDKKMAKKVHSQIEQIKIDTITSEVEPDMADYSINLYLIEELLEDKQIVIDDILEALSRYEKRGEIVVDEENMIIEINLDTEDIQKVQKDRGKIRKAIIRGVKGIERGIIKKSDDESEWMIITEGTNLDDVLDIKGVDRGRTYSNHIHEIEKVLGIEAARAIIINEAIAVLEDQSLDVDVRHLHVLADLMTVTGSTQQIGRHGISGKKKSVFARAAFEVTIKQLINASMRGEEEELLGIPENVIVGQIVPTIGTGSIDLEMDFTRTHQLLQKRKKTNEE